MDFLNKFLPDKDRKISYAQAGEDALIDFAFYHLGISRPSYLDIGAHLPTHLSNTYLFYRRGSRGICIEPDPFLFEKIQRKRVRDICLNIGVGSSKKQADFYIMDAKALSTFSKKEVENYGKYYGAKVERVKKVPILPVNEILKKYFKSSAPDLVSVDTEGMDFEIIKSFNFLRFRPKVFCVETMNYTGKSALRKSREIIDFMRKNDYFLFGDTFVNSIFVDRKAWAGAKQATLNNM